MEFPEIIKFEFMLMSLCNCATMTSYCIIHTAH